MVAWNLAKVFVGVRFSLPAPNRSHSIKALHYIGNVETQDRYLVRAPIKPIPTPDVMTVPGLSFYTTLVHLD